jgi:TonB family protein
MKQKTLFLWFIGLLLVPGILVCQKKDKEPVQRQQVTFNVKQGDSTVKQDIDVVYNPGQTKKEGSPDYVPYDQAPEVINQEQPKYPALALKAGLEGTVWTKLWVDETGRVAQAYVAKSDAQIFEQSALEAARQWRFKPAMTKGKPLATWVSIPFRFKIAGYPNEMRTDAAATKTIVGSSSGMGWQESLLILSVVLFVLLIRIILSIVAVIDIVRSRFTDPNDKLVWTIVSILLPIFGPILYFIMGKNQKVQQVNQ